MRSVIKRNSPLIKTGMIGYNESVTVEAQTCLAAFSYSTANMALFNCYTSSITALISEGGITCTYSNGKYTFKNTVQSKTARYNIIYR